MTDLTPENIARLRSVIDLAREQGLEDSGFILSERELTALLDAYEERDRLRAYVEWVASFENEPRHRRPGIGELTSTAIQALCADPVSP